MLSILSSVISILLLLSLKYSAETTRLEYVIKWFIKGGVSLYAGFLQGIFSGEGAKSIDMQISFVVLIFLLLWNQISGGQTAPKVSKGKNCCWFSWQLLWPLRYLETFPSGHQEHNSITRIHNITPLM